MTKRTKTRKAPAGQGTDAPVITPRPRGVVAQTRQYVKANPKKSAMFAFIALGFLVRGLFKRGAVTTSD